MSYLEGRARGELNGKGIWQLTKYGDGTIAKYDWLVTTTKTWMNILSPLAKPLFEWNHKIVMSWGAQSLAKRLGVKVIEE